MKRKRNNQRKTTDLRGVDPTSSAYWEEILARENLRMSRGDDTRLSYVSPRTLVVIEEMNAGKSTGRVAPHKPYNEFNRKEPKYSHLTGEIL